MGSHTHNADGSPILTQADLAKVTDAVVAACDAGDGLKDGLVEDPRKCAFDPSALACKAGTDETSCLTPAKIAALEKV